MELLEVGRTYAFGCFNNQSFKVIATHKEEAVVWQDGKTQIVDIVKDDLAEIFND